MHVRTKRHQSFGARFEKNCTMFCYPERDETAFSAISQQNKQYYVSFRQKNKFEYRNGYYGKK